MQSFERQLYDLNILFNLLQGDGVVQVRLFLEEEPAEGSFDGRGEARGEQVGGKLRVHGKKLLAAARRQQDGFLHAGQVLRGQSVGLLFLDVGKQG